jgi:hypothetical protein
MDSITWNKAVLEPIFGVKRQGLHLFILKSKYLSKRDQIRKSTASHLNSYAPLVFTYIEPRIESEIQ